MIHFLDEAERVRAVDRSGIIHRPVDPRLQRIVETAAQYFGVRACAISIIDHHRQWFAARVGIPAQETPRAQSFCLHAIRRPNEPLVVLDASRDDRFATNPFVTGAPHMRFYAGVPLLNPGGYALGALCLIDPMPRLQVPELLELGLLAREAERIIAL